MKTTTARIAFVIAITLGALGILFKDKEHSKDHPYKSMIVQVANLTAVSLLMYAISN